MKNIKKSLFKKTLIILCLFIFAPTVGFTEVRKEYYENGALKAEITFKKDKFEGPGKLYYENGALKQEYTYKKGKLEELVKNYDENGELIEKN